MPLTFFRIVFKRFPVLLFAGQLPVCRPSGSNPKNSLLNEGVRAFRLVAGERRVLRGFSRYSGQWRSQRLDDYGAIVRAL